MALGFVVAARGRFGGCAQCRWEGYLGAGWGFDFPWQIQYKLFLPELATIAGSLGPKIPFLIVNRGISGVAQLLV